jgi:hypothetical protein
MADVINKVKLLHTHPHDKHFLPHLQKEAYELRRTLKNIRVQ